MHKALLDSDGHHQKIFESLTETLRLRCQQPAFHPNATQFTLHLGAGVFAFWRQSIQREQSIFCLSNVTRSEQLINLADINLIGTDQWKDLLSGETLKDLEGRLKLSPYQTVWLTNLVTESDRHSRVGGNPVL